MTALDLILSTLFLTGTSLYFLMFRPWLHSRQNLHDRQLGGFLMST